MPSTDDNFMTPEHWRQVEELYHSALEQPPELREAFLASASAGNSGLRQEVLSLLQHAAEESRLDRPAWEGAQIGPYEILDKVGSGGMGDVWKARDTRLDRIVAIKRAKANFSERFEREARAVAALNHPHICTLYDVGPDYLVMEYVDGKPLHGPLPLKKAMGYAIEIAQALEAAHRAGIVHRDLKPANIFLAKQGVKLLDFGLARRFAMTPLAENDQTQTEFSTGEGVIVGTPAYMAPEQIEGRTTDARSDIFAFGCVVYEMLTGRRAFEGKSKASTMSAVLSQEPAKISEEVDAPEELQRIVSRCMRKDPERRFQDIADVRIAIQELSEESAAHTAKPVVRPAGRRRLMLAGMAAAVAIPGGTGWLYWGKAPAKVEATLRRVTSDGGLTTAPAFSPDGKWIAYASDRAGAGLDIWLQQLESSQSIRLTNDPADDHQPTFSPDGTQLLFRSERDHGGIYAVPILGGEQRLVAAGGFNPQFSPDGKKIAYWSGYSGGSLPASGWISSISGGSPRRFRPEFPGVRQLRWSPDGKFLGFVAVRDSSAPAAEMPDWWIAPVEGGAAVPTQVRRALRAQGAIPGELLEWEWSRSNQMLFAARHGSARNIWRVGIDPQTGRITAPAERLTLATESEFDPTSLNGRMIAFSAGESGNDIWSLNLNAGERDAQPALVRLTAGGHGRGNARPSISRDGHLVSYLSSKSGRARVWIKNVESGAEHVLTAGAGPEFWPVISPDGTRVAFTPTFSAQASALREGIPILIASVRTGVAEVVCADCTRPEDWSPDGSRLIYQPGSAAGSGFFELSLADRRTPIIQDPDRYTFSPQYSPDGRWVTRTSGDTRKIWVAPLYGPERPIPPARWIAITDGATIDREPGWSSDGSILYFASNRDGFQCLWSQRLNPGTAQPQGTAQPVRHFHSAALAFQPQDSGLFGIQTGNGRMVLSLSERTANVWTLHLP